MAETIHFSPIPKDEQKDGEIVAADRSSFVTPSGTHFRAFDSIETGPGVVRLVHEEPDAAVQEARDAEIAGQKPEDICPGPEGSILAQVVFLDTDTAGPVYRYEGAPKSELEPLLENDDAMRFLVSVSHLEERAA